MAENLLQGESTTPLYGRAAAVQINDKVFDKLRVSFRVEKSLKPRPNRVELSIWNLSEETRKALVKDVYIALEAGYREGTTLIFSGNLAKVDHTRIGPDWITSIRAGDGEKEIKKARINFSSSKSMKPEEVFNRITQELTKTLKGENPGFDPKISAGNVLAKARKGDTSGALKEISRGMTLMGSAFEHAVSLANNMGYDLSIQDKELVMLSENETLGEGSVILSPSTGLEGSPEQSEGKHVKARSRMNGRLRCGAEVILDSRQFQNGVFRVEQATFFGDTHGPDWSVDLVLKQLQKSSTALSGSDGQVA